jgi:hypothetical protein
MAHCRSFFTYCFINKVFLLFLSRMLTTSSLSYLMVYKMKLRGLNDLSRSPIVNNSQDEIPHSEYMIQYFQFGS